MKKIVLSALMSLMVFSLATSHSFAAGRHLRHSRRFAECFNEYQVRMQNFVDENNDGICDNQGKMMHENCENKMDENNDGKCDLYESSKHHGNRHHHGAMHQ